MSISSTGVLVIWIDVLTFGANQEEQTETSSNVTRLQPGDQCLQMRFNREQVKFLPCQTLKSAMRKLRKKH